MEEGSCSPLILLGPSAVLPSTVILTVNILRLISHTCSWRAGHFEARVGVDDLFYLGDTRSADDLALFTQMAPERLCLGCGLRVDEPLPPLPKMNFFEVMR